MPGRYFATVLCTLMGIFLILPVVGVGASLPWPWSAGVIGGDLLLVAYPLWRTRRVSLVVGQNSITVVNYLRAYEMQWPEISSIEVGAGSMLILNSDAVAFNVRDGRRVLCQASVGSRKWIEKVLAALRPNASRWSIAVIDEVT